MKKLILIFLFLFSFVLQSQTTYVVPTRQQLDIRLKAVEKLYTDINAKLVAENLKLTNQNIEINKEVMKLKTQLIAMSLLVVNLTTAQNIQNSEIQRLSNYQSGLITTLDSDAVAYLVKIGIPNNSTVYYSGTPQEISGSEIYNAVSRYNKTIKTANIYSKIKAEYFFIGGTASAHKWNAKNLLDTDTAFRLTFLGTGTHSKTGYQNNTSSSYANTNYNQQTNSALGNESIGFYSKTDIQGSFCDMGVGNTSVANRATNIFSNSGGNFSTRMQTESASGFTIPTSNSIGFHCISRTDTNEFRAQKDNVITVSPDDAQYIYNLNYTLGARNTNGTMTFFTPREYAYAFIGEGLTETEMLAHYTAVEQLQTDLKRSENPIVVPVVGLKAFPEAYGAGAYTTGGRGGTVIKVTNLNDSGVGSLRAALTTSGARTVVFEVSGTIEIITDIVLTSAHSNLTIAGQSAPQGGITITGKVVYFQNNIDNVIMRYLRFRPDYNSSGVVDALSIINSTNLIADHCSVSWGGDEAIDIVGTSSNITIQNSIFGESATGMLAGDSDNPLSDNISVIGNLWYNISHRFPNVNALNVESINNMVHNWNSRLSVVSAHNNTNFNEINNYYQSGTKTQSPTTILQAINWMDMGSASQKANTRIYTNGNNYPAFSSGTNDNWNLYVYRFNVTSGAYAGGTQGGAVSTDIRRLTPFPYLGVAPTITTAAEAKTNVTSNSGANKYLNADGTYGTFRDNVDSIYITNAINGTSESYSYPPTDIVNKQSYIDFHNSVSSTPINTRPVGFDTNNDGIPDVWATSNVPAGKTANDTAPNGYPYLENYLNSLTILQ